jgi:SAM-dependent methyltransferase
LSRRPPTALIFQLLAPVSELIARQVARPRGWFGRTVVTRALNRGNRGLIEATLEGVSLAPETRLLDVGFGGGLLLELARRRGVHRLAGVDPSDAAVTWLRSRRGWGPGPAPRLEVGVVEALPFEGAAFDVVTTTNTVYFWPDLSRAFAELFRVIGPGGVLSVGFTGADKLRSFENITRHGFQLHANEELVAAATRAGFVGVRIVDLHGRVTEGDHVLRATRPNSPSAR